MYLLHCKIHSASLQMVSCSFFTLICTILKLIHIYEKLLSYWKHWLNNLCLLNKTLLYQKCLFKKTSLTLKKSCDTILYGIEKGLRWLLAYITKHYCEWSFRDLTDTLIAPFSSHIVTSISCKVTYELTSNRHCIIHMALITIF